MLSKCFRKMYFCDVKRFIAHDFFSPKIWTKIFVHRKWMLPDTCPRTGLDRTEHFEISSLGTGQIPVLGQDRNFKILCRPLPAAYFRKKYFSKIPMFCFRKTGNFKTMLPVNWLTWKMIQKNVCWYLSGPSRNYGDKGHPWRVGWKIIPQLMNLMF